MNYIQEHCANEYTENQPVCIDFQFHIVISCRRFYDCGILCSVCVPLGGWLMRPCTEAICLCNGCAYVPNTHTCTMTATSARARTAASFSELSGCRTYANSPRRHLLCRACTHT